MWAPAPSATASKLVPALVLSTAGLRFLLTGIYQLTASDAWEDVAGIVGLVLGAFALYAAYAAEYEDVLKHPLLTLGRRGKGELAVKGTYSQQIAEVAHEPGVRQQLQSRRDPQELAELLARGSVPVDLQVGDARAFCHGGREGRAGPVAGARSGVDDVALPATLLQRLGGRAGAVKIVDMRAQQIHVTVRGLRGLELERARDDPREVVGFPLEDALRSGDEPVHLHVRPEVGGELLGTERLRRRLETGKGISRQDRLGLGRGARAAARESEKKNKDQGPTHRLTLDSKPFER
jgi:hypothetical protein